MTTDFVSALCVPDDRGAGLWVVIECTHPDDRPRLIDSVIEHGTGMDVLDDAADQLAERVAGWKRWEAMHVWQHTLGAWPEVDGELMSRGVDVCELPVDRATNVVYHWWRNTLSNNEKAWKKWDKDMRREPRRVIKREADKPMDPAAFAQLQQLTAAASAGHSGAAADSTITMPQG